MAGLAPVRVPPRGRWDPSPPVGEKPPGTRSRDRARRDPEPALGLVIPARGGWASGTGGAIRRRLGRERRLPLARGGAWRIRLERWKMPLWGEVGWNFPPRASAGLPRKNTFPQTFRRYRRKLLKMLRNAGRSERI
jgi:hypothetical protein